jgi:ATP-binding cassette, subfamily B, bacterial MsbA
VIRRILSYFKDHIGAFSGALVAMALAAPITAGSMWILKQVVDKALLNKDYSMLQNIVLLMVAMYVMKALLSYIHDYLTYYVGQSVVKTIRDQVYSRLHELSMDFFTATDSARIISKLTADAQLLQNALTKIPVMIVRDGLTVIVLTGFLFKLHWRFALITFILLPLSGWLVARFGKSLRKSSRAGQAKMADLYTLIQETISGQAVVKAFLREDHERERFTRVNQEYFKIYLKNARVESLSSPVMELIGAAALAVILWFGGKDVISGVWSAGDFFAFIGSALSLYQPVKYFSRSHATIQQALSGSERLFELLDAKPTVKQKPGAAELPGFRSEIKLEKVDFAYRPDRPVLQGVDLTVKKGELIALVGPSGSGKTTLAALLLRFYDPREGAVRIDGHDLKDVTFHSLRRQIGLVTQETMLFNDTVRHNLAYGKPDAAEAEIVAAAKAANAWEFIEKLPQGLDTLVGERGILLSGGQKQRLAIARAILKNPPILVLDEATSALDAQSERLVQEAMDRLMKDRTAVVIAHRLATVKNATRIVVLEHGRIVETGPHAELLAAKGLYNKLYELQLLEA